MAIRSERYLREMYCMVRKGSFRFVPEEMPLHRERTASGERKFRIGGVGYDFDTGELQYTLYDEAYRPVPSGEGVSFRNVKGLKGDEMARLHKVVSEYSERSVHRSRYMEHICSVLYNGGKAEDYIFPEGAKPEIVFEDSPSTGCGMMRLEVNSMWRDSVFPDSVFLDCRRTDAGGPGRKVYVPVAFLTDSALYNVYNSMERGRSEERHPEEERTVNVKHNRQQRL